MINVTFNPQNITAAVQTGAPLLDAARAAGVTCELPCGGKGSCGKCLVKIESGRVDFRGALSDEFIRQGYVLICRSYAADCDVTVLTRGIEGEKGKFSDSYEDYARLAADLKPSAADIDFPVKRIELRVPAPKPSDGLSDIDRFTNTLITQGGGGFVLNANIPLSVIQKLPSALRENDGNVSVFYHISGDTINVVDINSQFSILNSQLKPSTSHSALHTPHSDNNSQHLTNRQPPAANRPVYGFAVDIGTTTVAVILTDSEGSYLSAKTAYNEQIFCGLDVISRINYAKKKNGLSELREKVLSSINKLTDELCSENGIDPGQIRAASVSCNTTMAHLFLGIEPEYIRLNPYAPAAYNFPLFTASDVGLEIHENAPVDIAPAVGSYVGGDITAGLLCTQLVTASEKICLFIDIGTNGEIVLGNNEFLMACACSAGPAFEGGGITHGMRAAAGAIEKAEIDPKTKKLTVRTIGNLPPAGICGSGMISLLAEMFKAGFIDAAGRFDRNAGLPLKITGRTASLQMTNDTGQMTNFTFHLSPPTSTSQFSILDSQLKVSEPDIDNIIRAKAAVFSACRTLLKKAGLDFADVQRLYIAGGFGRWLDLDDAAAIGLLPRLGSDKYVFLGNSSLMGAYMSLISPRHRALRDKTAKKITYIDLGAESGYMEEYTAALFLPHTDGNLFRE